MFRSEPVASFQASLFKITTDHEGEARIILAVPLSELAEVTKLYLTIGKLLRVSVGVEADAP